MLLHLLHAPWVVPGEVQQQSVICGPLSAYATLYYTQITQGPRTVPHAKPSVGSGEFDTFLQAQLDVTKKEHVNKRKV